MPLDQKQVDTPFTAEWWMCNLATRLLDRNRLVRLATLKAHRSGCPPMPQMVASQRHGFYAFQRVSRSNFARPIINNPAQRMAIRAIRTAAADDANGDEIAWRYFTANGLDIAATDVHSDMLTFAEAYVRVGMDGDGVTPIALRRDPWSCITVPDPLNPMRTLAAFELVWDETTGYDYAYLWLPGQQWVAARKRESRPGTIRLAGLTADDARRYGLWFPNLSFDSAAFDMRPNVDEVAPAERDGGPYSQTFNEPVVPVVRFDNRDGVGEFEEHLDLLDRINHTIMTRVVTAAIQAYKQRALEQDGADGADRLPAKHPDTGQPIDWAELFQPGPDALWKLPPGVKIWESSEVQLQPILSAVEADVKHLSAVTDTPLPLLSDDTNSSAEAAQLRREGQVFKVEDREVIAGRRWAQVMSLLFLFASDDDRFSDVNGDRRDRADAGRIVVVWKPAERFSLAERSAADAANKSLSADMAAEKIWGLTPDEVQINKAQRASDVFAQAAQAAMMAPKPAPAAEPVPASVGAAEGD